MTRVKITKRVGIITIIAFAVLALVFALNYFNRLSIPFLQQKVAIACPVPKDLCSKGKAIITADGKVVGIGFNLPIGIPLSASFEGTAQLGMVQDGKTKEKHPIVWLHGKENLEGYVAAYNFYGTPLVENTSSEVKQNASEKQSLGYMGYGNFSKDAPYNGVNFIFSLRRGDKFTSPPLPLEKIEFKK